MSDEIHLCINCKKQIEYKPRYAKVGYPKRHTSCNKRIREKVELIRDDKKITHRNFEFISYKCKCGCEEIVQLNKEKISIYERLGYPEYIPGHHLNDQWKESEFRERMTGENSSMYGKGYLLSGENNGNWNGGTSFFPYCTKFNRHKKEEIRNKYNNCCIICSKPESENITKTNKVFKLSVHHIDYNKQQGCEGQQWKLVPLCINCHGKTTYGNRQLWETKICEILTKNLQSNEFLN